MLHTDMDPLPDDAAINLKTPEQVKYYHGNSVQLDALTHDQKKNARQGHHHLCLAKKNGRGYATLQSNTTNHITLPKCEQKGSKLHILLGSSERETCLTM